MRIQIELDGNRNTIILNESHGDISIEFGDRTPEEYFFNLEEAEMLRDSLNKMIQTIKLRSDWMPNVWLEEVPGRHFNSVNFENIKEEQ